MPKSPSCAFKDNFSLLSTRERFISSDPIWPSFFLKSRAPFPAFRFYYRVSRDLPKQAWHSFSGYPQRSAGYVPKTPASIGLSGLGGARNASRALKGYDAPSMPRWLLLP